MTKSLRTVMTFLDFPSHNSPCDVIVLCAFASIINHPYMKGRFYKRLQNRVLLGKKIIGYNVIGGKKLVRTSNSHSGKIC